MRLNRGHRATVDGSPAPDRIDEYRLYQILLGTWPNETMAPDQVRVYTDRIREYMTKAAREGKTHTSWLTTNPGYEEGLAHFIERALSGAGERFMSAVQPFQRRIAAMAVTNSLAQVVLKIGSPGVPDFYQGTELWDLSLVDPDNRRPVDFELRSRLLDELDEAGPGAAASLLASWQDGRIKLFVTAAGLRARRELPHVFVGGGYLPLTTDVTVPAGLIAFARTSGDDAVIVVVPHLAARLTGSTSLPPVGADIWKTSRVMLPEGLRDRTFRNILTGDEIRPTVGAEGAWIFAGQIFEKLPVGVLRAI
jgi:(1->4)-alpha-D-glucan 1-alpha-D-glucosylmutase